MKNTAEKVILFAYDKPRYSTESNRSEAITDFVNEVYILCYNSAPENTTE